MAVANERLKIRWKWGVVASVSLMLLALYPQLHFWVIRGSQWHGSYIAMEGVGDEVAYSAYVNALIDGRPRRNDPYTGIDHNGDNAQSESLFSMQFVPAYTIASAARLLGVSADTAFILLPLLAAGAASLILFWFLTLVTGDDCLGATGAVLVLCLGTIAGGHGHFVSFLGLEPLYNYLIFLRRYQPSASFPLFLAYCAFTWRAITAGSRRSAGLFAVASGIILGLLVFSYVYLWTAGVAWLGCLALSLIVVQPPGWRQSLKPLGLIAAIFATALIPFAILYSNRASTLDSVQALEISRAPDLFRFPEVISAVLLLALAYYLRSKRPISKGGVVIAASFALLPIVLFNQQVLTGRSLQPLHYEMFVANYAALIALVLTTVMIFQAHKGLQFRIPRKALFWIALAAFDWGIHETFVATVGSMPFASRIDSAKPVALRLRDLAQSSSRDEPGHATVLVADLLIADGLPTTAPQSVLWAPHMLVFSGASSSESRERFYQYLYYMGIGAEQLKRILMEERRYGFAVGLFGFERTIKGLSVNPRPIGSAELEDELRRYAEYCASFTRERATKVRLSYLLVASKDEPDLSRLDAWYERDQGERVNNYTLYRVRLRDDVWTGKQAEASHTAAGSAPGSQTE